MIRGKYLTSMDDTAAVMALRHAVFVLEQGFAPEIEVDEYDKMAVYALVSGEAGEPVATGRLIVKDDRFTIGRICCLKEHRGRGYGDFVVRMLMQRALDLNCAELHLSSQLHTVDFYRRFGFEPVGETYLEEGVAHRAMRVTREAMAGGCCGACGEGGA